ncbi:MAG TPA: hypothetical protein VGY55_11565 [Pirellulales bacterium]|jgi:hypothetical protein|nr:hypothetical protein [Xanthobacteraceae bacterium]HEV2970598.1 hypothetical protein [Pirellulales bacterium]
MSEAAVIGREPVSLLTSTGQQVSIPLTALYFDSNGKLHADRWPLYSKFSADVDPWLAYLVKTGELTPAASPPPVAAMTITAADAGPAGNNIEVNFKNIVPDSANPPDPGKGTFDVDVVETDTYTGLSYDSTKSTDPNFISNVLGIADQDGKVTKAGTRPGLVLVLAGDTPAQPSNNPPLTFSVTAPATAATAAVAANFHLVAKKPGADGKNTTVTISSVDTGAKTFSLKAVWTLNATNKKLSDLSNLAGYEISVTVPAVGSTITALPAAGAVKLTGGAAAQSASNASATVYAD